MGGPGRMLGEMGCFVVGKRKFGVGRYQSKEHVYICLERGRRKIRRIVVRDKFSDALSVFSQHIKLNTEICVDPGIENVYFDNLPAVITLHEIPGPIHVDPAQPRLNTQTVETSHSGVKMRLCLGHGVYRHHLQAIMDYEDFVYNRTNGTLAAILKKLGDAAKAYCSTPRQGIMRLSNIPLLLADDMF